jgi:ABC-type glycerol-3-phosphate transport system substrate-binding protein
MLRVRHALAGLGILSAACLSAGCGASDTRSVLHFWAMGREGEVVQELLPEFERLHPDIRIEVEQLPWSEAHQKLLTAVAGDSTPDLCQLGNSWIPEFVALKALAPLQQRIAASATIQPADYFSGIWDSNAAGAAIYGVPWYVDTRLLFYRTDLIAEAGFAAPPASWSEWLRVLAAIKERAHGERFGILLPLNDYDPLIALALQQSQPMLRDNGTRGNFANPEFERTFGFYVDMFRNLRAVGARLRDLERLDRIRARLFRVLHQRTLGHRRISAPLAGGARRQVDDRAAARSRRSRRIDCRRLEPRGVSRLQTWMRPGSSSSFCRNRRYSSGFTH